MRAKHCRNDDVLKELKLLIRARYGLIWLETAEEDRAESLVRYLADDMQLPFFTWALDQGLCRGDAISQEVQTAVKKSTNGIFGTKPAKSALLHIESAELPGVYHLQGFGALLDDRALSAKLTAVWGCDSDRERVCIARQRQSPFRPSESSLA